MSENEVKPVVAKKKPAAKKAAAPVAAKPAPKKKAALKAPAKKKTFIYAINGKASDVVYHDQKAMLEDISMSASKEDTITIYRESRSGSLKTKVRIG